MKKLMLCAVAMSALLTGCMSTYKNDGGDSCLMPNVVKDIAYEKYDVANQPVTATEQKVGIFPSRVGNLATVGGVSSHYADNVDENAQYTQETIRLAKNGAYAIACEKAGCDSLVGTRYKIDYKWYYLWDEATVTVTGYPAKLIGVEFRKADLSADKK